MTASLYLGSPEAFPSKCSEGPVTPNSVYVAIPQTSSEPPVIYEGPGQPDGGSPAHEEYGTPAQQPTGPALTQTLGLQHVMGDGPVPLARGNVGESIEEEASSPNGRSIK